MKGVDRYFDNYNPGPQAAPGTYSADHFRENLLELLRLKDMTQADAAEKCGVTAPVINNWIMGRNEPNLYGFARLCEGLEIEPNWLLSKHEKIRRSKGGKTLEDQKATAAGAEKGGSEDL